MRPEQPVINQVSNLASLMRRNVLGHDRGPNFEEPLCPSIPPPISTTSDNQSESQ